MLKNVNDELEAENSALKEFIQKAFKYIRIASKSLFDTISDIFSNELTEPLLNDEKKTRNLSTEAKKLNSGQIWPLYSPKIIKSKNKTSKSSKATRKSLESLKLGDNRHLCASYRPLGLAFMGFAPHTPAKFYPLR